MAELIFSRYKNTISFTTGLRSVDSNVLPEILVVRVTQSVCKRLFLNVINAYVGGIIQYKQIMKSS